MRTAILLVLLFLAIAQKSQAQAVNLQDVLRSGQIAGHYIAAHFATGYWNKKGDKPLCPVLGEVEQTKVAIYVKEANTGTIAIAVELDRMIRKFPQLSRSFLIVSEESRSESMTDDELATKLKELKELGELHGIEKLSLAYLQYSTVLSRWKNSLGFFGSADVVVAVIEPGISRADPSKINERRLPVRTVKPFCRFVERIHSKDIDQRTAEMLIAKALASLSD